MTDLEARKQLLARLRRREPVASQELKRALGDENWTDYQLRCAWVKTQREEAKNAFHELRDYVRLLRIADLCDAQPHRSSEIRQGGILPQTSPSAKYEQALERLSELVEQNGALAQYLDRTFSPYRWDGVSDIDFEKESVPRIVYHMQNVRPAPELTRIIQPVARGDEKMQFERYDIVLLLSRGRASSSRVVDQRCDLHLFVG
jgi:hypothetical protein